MSETETELSNNIVAKHKIRLRRDIVEMIQHWDETESPKMVIELTERIIEEVAMVLKIIDDERN